ncbi:hypothetical protein G6F46_004941 [Rhizopus delemar]|uniref:FFD box profile domain-containing protein n=3 Tax=Rhizopus TaxID=4842 RepID=I1BLK9_RHIO9|nr:hypothetical protein RO3G_01793 [Rhizopus delemar RA 99-880]KAG1462401.1 hypothetical protein G6F55_002992 [Rhizopus delemar]KAG1550137.1 hypothetical protein G6F51_002620 [Rhizopus arrhizus]KAG1500501.1 hypothetical protein G6F54_003670 [Rhizopus delemar]KAG1516461.1 hypothetical protein G6F53_002149 [Rhizopus delemar]|eukprot:EIE77089.1 hypothetical protein RO3G_01793 [Rhizopus delemar RA 99-880]
MSGENYIGSKISLISLSDIRYVGILHSINAQDSTVGLKQVRSFGTEGRKGNSEEEIPPSEHVFDYVVFRGSDIKDLQVFEAPPKPTPPPPQSLPQDPAIMSMSGYPPPMNPYMGGNMYMQPPQQQQQQQQPFQSPVVPQQQQQQHSQQPSQQQQKQKQKQQFPQQPPQAAQSYWKPTLPEPEVDQLEKDTLDELKAELEEAAAQQPTINEATIEELAKKVSELNPVDEPKQASLDEQYRSNNRRQENNRGKRHNNDRQANNRNKQDFNVPSSEFDFEASNAKFDKNELTKKDEVDDLEEVTEDSSDGFYNKSSSFFDNISCESKERSEQRENEPRRNRFQEERKLNMETFGQATADQSRYRHNYHRGRGGNYRGRGGYYRGNNRSNNNNDYRQNKA